MGKVKDRYIQTRQMIRDGNIELAKEILILMKMGESEQGVSDALQHMIDELREKRIAALGRELDIHSICSTWWFTCNSK